MTLDIIAVPAGEIFEIKTLTGLVIEMFRSAKYSGDREGITGFRPAKVLKGKDVVWFFKKNDGKPLEFGELVECDDEYIIAIRDKRAVTSIVRVNNLTHTTTALLKGKVVTIGGSSVEELLDFKIATAMELGIDYWRSTEEEEILKQRKILARKKYQEELAKQEAERAQARAKSEANKASILARGTVEAWSSKGQKMFGIPVTNDDEWKCLPDGKFCIMMQDDKPIEAFIIEKKGSKVSKIRPTEVSAEMPKQKVPGAKESMPEALDQVKVTIRGDSRQILVFENMSSLKQLQSAGLNSGTWVGVNAKDDKPMTVYAIRKDSIETIGQVARQQQEA
jgi:hypothetical protein